MKLPICPYCHTVYRYKDIIQLKGKETVCYYCKETFGINRKYRAVPVIIACVVLILFDVLVLFTSEDIQPSTLTVLIIADAVTVFSVMLFSPTMTRFEKMKGCKDGHK